MIERIRASRPSAADPYVKRIEAARARAHAAARSLVESTVEVGCILIEAKAEYARVSK